MARTAARDQYRYGLTLLIVAPIALVVLPEFAQHVAGMKLGCLKAGR
ncbi:hypothetical protein [Sphingomonas aerophila]|uniref:Uncharacterized protein n=1 Tax=Sphingomonas aerophila TaxID=1344948 RepID=A0A7W9ET25_9SPHN|nr:hypothetical protein [Sphingomonas aerophila]MBB5713735.1 hypothetical protein [Sphingomonas aerophila]